jgi:hypothetical protein
MTLDQETQEQTSVAILLLEILFKKNAMKNPRSALDMQNA